MAAATWEVMERNLPALRSDLADLHRWVHLPNAGALPPVLVALRDATQRIEISAALVCRGVRIVLARNAAQAQTLLRATEIVIADTRILADLDLRARQALRAVALIAIDDGCPDARAVASQLGALRVVPVDVEPQDVVALALNAYSLGGR
jgi:hypothetical protein